MKWVGILFAWPLWGVLSTQLFFQCWLAGINFLFGVLGFVLGRVPRRDAALACGVALFGVVLFAILLRAGSWLLTEVLPFGHAETESIAYWGAAAFSAVFMLRQMPAKLRKSWRHVMLPGSLEADIRDRRRAEFRPPFE